MQITIRHNKNQDIVARESGYSSTSYTQCFLHPASQYSINVAACNARGCGLSVSITVWTEVSKPPTPKSPVVRMISDTSVQLSISPVALTSGLVSGYFIVVSEVGKGKRKKRSQSDPAALLGLSGYTSAALYPSEVSRERLFLVGDDSYYGGYHNKPLKTDTDYVMYYVVASSLDDITKMSHVQIPLLIHTNEGQMDPSPTKRSSGTQGAGAKESDHSAVVVGVVLGSILVLVFVGLAIGVFYWIRKKKSKRALNLQEDSKHPNWLSYYTEHFYNSAHSEQVSAGKTQSFEDLAKIMTDNSVMDASLPVPGQIKVSNFHHNRPEVDYSAEYHTLPNGCVFPCKVAEQSCNKSKNRFEHILPYDHSRIVLKDHTIDYINASYIDGYEEPNAFIACQSPFSDSTVEDFWYMVNQEKVTKIVFMARLVEDGVVKCVPYWPKRDSKQYGTLTVSLLTQERYANFNVYKFELKPRSGKPRHVMQYQFMSWPDHGLPEDCSAFLQFVRKVSQRKCKESGPTLVHCGTGVSKSAVFIAVVSLLQQAKVESVVNVLGFCRKMRQNRAMMVRTVKQYGFIYEVIFEALITNYNIVGKDLKDSYRMLSEENPVTKRSHLSDQFDVLEKYIPGLTSENCQVALKKENGNKNRFQTMALMPSDAHRVILKSSKNGRTDYINALYLDSYYRQNAFIVTQMPLISTLVDFWQMVYDNNVRTIIMLDGKDLRDVTCARYWPHGDTPSQNYGPFSVSLTSTENHSLVTIRSLELSSIEDRAQAKRLIYHIQCEGWEVDAVRPNSCEAINELIELAEGSQWSEDRTDPSPPVVVHCVDGATRSGLFCACFTLAETLRHEGEVDIFHTLKHFKCLRPKFIPCLVSKAHKS